MYKSFRGWKRDVGIDGSLTELVDLARVAGFKGVEIDIQEAVRLVDSKGLEQARRIFADANVLPAGWFLPVNWSSDEGTYWKATGKLAELPRLAEVAKQLGCIRVVSAVRPCSDKRPFEQNFDWHVKRLRPIAEILKDKGCRLALEYIGSKSARSGHRYEFIHDIEGMLELCDALETGNVGLLLDSWHWYTAQEKLKDIEQLTPEQVVYVHVNDAPRNVPLDQLGEGPREIPGETGVIDLVGFLRCLGKIGYDGPIVPEPDHRFCDEIRRMSAPEAARALSEAIDRLWAKAGLSPRGL